MAAPLAMRVATMPTVPAVPEAPFRYLPAERRVGPAAGQFTAKERPDQRQEPLSLRREANSVALSGDGKRAAVGLQDHTLQIWDLDSRMLLHVLRGHKYWVTAVAFSRDGALLASGSADKSIKVWQPATASCKATLQGHLLSVSAVAFSADRRRLVSGSWDKKVCIWDVETASCIQTLHGHTDWVHSVAWSPGGHQVASASSDHSVRVWDVTAGAVDSVLVGHLQTVSSVCFAANGLLASGSLDGTVRLWNLKEGVLVARLRQESDESSIHSVAFSADGELIVAGCGDKNVKVWNVGGEQLLSLAGHEDIVQSVAVTADGRALSCSHDKTLRVWRLPGRPVVYSQVPRMSPVYMRPMAPMAPLAPMALTPPVAPVASAPVPMLSASARQAPRDVKRFETGEDNVAASAVEEPAAKVPETPPKLQLPTSPAGVQRSLGFNGLAGARPSLQGILPTTMAGGGCGPCGSVGQMPGHASPMAPCQSMLVQGPLDSPVRRPASPRLGASVPSARPVLAEPVTRSAVRH
ncbi:unnamed protein product [Effrenium voratum]|uniref:Uncharacterized protein n=1 Tax=Effrenium voratum TaxID=2562239 RepID=A0AA36N4K4_9DINO|nr:unnamed protein product [Effrenium voratum]CAJ1447654.1 unnamed protein product [Effrenium voratum]